MLYFKNSTYSCRTKILKYNVLQDENTVIEWDGIKRYFYEWNKDLNLKEALIYYKSTMQNF